MIRRGYVDQQQIELAAENAALRAENAQLHEALAIERRRSADLCDYGNRGWARVGMLSARTRRLLRLAKWWRAPGRKPMTEHVKALMACRYLMLGGLEHGKGGLVSEQVQREFRCSASKVDRVLREYKAKRVTKAEAIRDLLAYRRVYERDRNSS